ncbi:MAG: glycosyltransferase family 2 protein [Gemmatimonadetes bacterium]|nr:glycosyltransferase family 2 protein [Gemmatimonadota bacterium]
MHRDGVVSVVVPVFNEEANIQPLYERMDQVARRLAPLDLELLFVDDGSTDDSVPRMSALAEKDPRVRVIKLARNFGHQLAITAGLDHAQGDCVIVIDADLQDPPEVIPRMVERWQDGFDVVYGVRERRDGEGAMKRWTAKVFYRLLRRMTKVEIPVDVGDFRLLSRRAAAELRGMREQDRFVRGLVSWIGLRQTGVEYVREARHAGETKYPYRRMLKFALDGITSFSIVPLRLATWLGYAASGFAFVYLLSVFVQKWMGATVEGWATIMVAMLFLGGIQLICLGIMGEYIGRIFTEIKGRPLYVVDEVVASGAGDRPGVEPDRHAAERGSTDLESVG